MSQKFRGGPTGGQVTSAPVKKAAVWVVIGALVLLFLIGLAIYATYCRMNGKTVWKSATAIKTAYTEPGFGPDSVPVTTSFDGCKRIWNQDGTKFVDGHVVDKNVPWEIEYDGDPTKRYAMPPYNVPGEYTLTYKQPCTYFRIRILPNPEEKTSGEYAFRRVPR